MLAIKSATIAIAMILIACVNVASSAEISNFFGHAVTIEGEYPERSIKIDGRSVHSDAILSINEVAIVSGIPVIVGSSSNGGNACDGTPFVMSFPQSRQPRFDGPLDTCFSTHYTIGETDISFSTNDIPGKGAERWVWTPQDGIRKLADKQFAPNAETGWNDLRERAIDHPSDIFKNVEIANQIQRLLGPRLSEYRDIIIGTGSGEFKGDDFVATACTAHMCGEQEAMVFLEAQTRMVYVAWRPFEKKIVVLPPVKEWPEKARSELRTWAAKWK